MKSARRAGTPAHVQTMPAAQAESAILFKGRQFSSDLASRVDLLEAANCARSSVRAGCKPGDLRWNHPARDFAWPDANGVRIKMDAYTLLALAAEFARHGEHFRLTRLRSN